MKSRFFTPQLFIPLPLRVLGVALLAFSSGGQADPAPITRVEAPIAPPTAFIAAPPVAEQDAVVLARYQLALDQLSAGATGTARVILEDSIRRYGPRPEVNLLLAYVLQREGNNNGALNVTNQVAKTSPLALAFSSQLQGSAGSNNVLAAGNVAPVALNPVIQGNGLPTGQKNGSTLLQSDARLTKLEVAMMGLVNAERAKAGLGALQWNDDLANVARAHSAEMRDKNYFSHESPTAGLTTHLDRYRAAGHEPPRVIAENIFRAWGSPKQVSLVDIQGGHDALMQSPGHRANILYRDVTHIGIGIATTTQGDLWITQMYLRP